MHVLVVNFGSSSLKFQVIETDAELMASGRDRVVAKGQVERMGGLAIHDVHAAGKTVRRVAAVRTPREALLSVLGIVEELMSPEGAQDHGDGDVAGATPPIGRYLRVDAVGHRVVHGGERFKSSVRIDAEVERGIADCIELAPLHNPWNLKGIEAVRGIFGTEVPQVAVFDTAFHATMPEQAYLYAIPYQLYRRHRIRRYGFHGTSHRYVGFRYRTLFGLQREDCHIISVHLGSGCSACAIEGGVSVDTSMGFTPLEGLVMGTRSGDIDPSIVEFLCQKEGYSLAEVDAVLNKQSGLLGLSGLTHDMRELLAEEAEHGDRRVHLAIDIFCRRVRKQIGAYLAVMERCDAVVFTGGIGTHASEVRQRILRGLDSLGVRCSADLPAQPEGLAEGEVLLSAPDSPRRVLAIPTNEELVIARDTFRCLTLGSSPG